MSVSYLHIHIQITYVYLIRILIEQSKQLLEETSQNIIIDGMKTTLKNLNTMHNMQLLTIILIFCCVISDNVVHDVEEHVKHE